MQSGTAVGETGLSVGDLMLTRAADATFVLDVRTGSVMYRWHDPSWSRIRLTPEAGGDRLVSWVHPDDLPGVLGAFAGAVHGSGARTASARLHPDKVESNGVSVLITITDVRDRIDNGMLAQVWIADIWIEDITKLQRAEAGRAEAEELFRAVFHGSPLATALVGLDGRFVLVNESFSVITGYSAEQLQDLRVQDITHPDDMSADVDLFSEVLGGTRASYQMEKRYLHRAGHEVWVELTVGPVRRPDGTIGHVLSHVEDITSRRTILQSAGSDELAYWATHDHLTGLPNRRHLDNYLESRTGNLSRSGDRMVVLFIDLDDFKPVNDRYSHRIGDEVLRTIARRLRNSCRGEALVARYGGDEFVVVSRQLRTRADVHVLIDRITSAICTPITDLLDTPIRIGASIGVGMAREGDRAATVMERADEAAHRAKRDGKNVVRFLE